MEKNDTKEKGRREKVYYISLQKKHYKDGNIDALNDRGEKDTGKRLKMN